MPRKAASPQLDFGLPADAMRLEVQYLAHDLIEPDPEQPRDEPDAELRDSIARQGILQPLTVRAHPSKRGRYMIIDGERRWKGAAGVMEVVPVLVRHDQEEELDRLITQLGANSGKPLTPMEEARAFARACELSGKSAAEVAELAGRPRSTVGDRLALLELGPWQPLIEKGVIPVSYAVRALVPLRGVPDDCHRQAIAAIQKDYRWAHRTKAEKGGISYGDFERMVRAYYAKFMYPLKKSSTNYGKQPEFDTRAHDKECECGTISFELDYGGKRKCCGNPDWWRPRHRKALAEKKKKSGSRKSESRGGPRYHLPDGTPTIMASYHNEPRGVTLLTDSQGRWNTRELECDPADLVIDDAKLVRIERQYGGTHVGTKDAAAITTARAKWGARWSARREQLSRALERTIQQYRDTEGITGPGTVALLRTIAAHYGDDVVDLADALRIPVPASVRNAAHWERGGKVRAWLKSLSPIDAQPLAEALLTAMAVVATRNLTLTTPMIEKELREAEHAIEKRRVPWLAAPKQAKRKKANATGRPRKAKTEDVEDEAPAVCEYCGEDDCDGTCEDDSE